MTTKTVGQASYELLQKPPEEIHAVDLQQEMQKSTIDQIQEIIEKHKSYAEEYYIVLMYRKERLIPNVIRQQFIVRKTRPIPDYDCSLFSFNNKTNELIYHWTIPDPDSCAYIMINSTNLSDDHKPLLEFVKKFSEGSLV